MVGTPVSTRDRLCHQHVPLVSPPDEDIVQQVPLSQPRVNPDDLSHRQAEVGVGQGEPVVYAGSTADAGGEFVSPERRAEAHMAIVSALRQTGQSSHDVSPDGKGDARVPSLCLGPTVPEEGMADTHLLQLALFGEPGLAECCDVRLVARQFPSH
nr:unnamed protein product [Spirometra erinaceieuropaei]